MTDNITLPRATVQQALEALLLPTMKTQQMLIQRDEAIIALRRVLEQQAEPVAWIAEVELSVFARAPKEKTTVEIWKKPVLDSDVAIYTAPPQRKPLPKGEWPKHKSPYVKDEYIGYAKSDLDDYAMQVLAAHGIKEGT